MAASPGRLTVIRDRSGDSLSVTVVDETGWVRELAIVTPTEPFGKPSFRVENGEGRDDVLVVRWVGGRCHAPPVDTVITLTPRGDRVGLTLVERWTLQACTNDMGVFREVELYLDQPLPADNVDAEHLQDPKRNG
jgi:hypothetical protein